MKLIQEYENEDQEENFTLNSTFDFYQIYFFTVSMLPHLHVNIFVVD